MCRLLHICSWMKNVIYIHLQNMMFNYTKVHKLQIQCLPQLHVVMYMHIEVLICLHQKYILSVFHNKNI